MPKFTDDQVRRIRTEYAENEALTIYDLADEYDVSAPAMSALLKGRSYPKVPGAVTIRHLRGSRRGEPCGDPAKTEWIQSLIEEGLSTYAIAQEVECSTGHVHYIRHRSYDYLKSA